MTIREAVIEVLKSEGRPMQSNEIATIIRARGLHPLPTKYPGSVVNKAIRRHCLGVETDGSRPDKVFRALHGRRYSLI